MPLKIGLVYQSNSNPLRAQILEALELPIDQALPLLKRLGRMTLQPSNSSLRLIEPEPVAPSITEKPDVGGPAEGGGEAR
jgi:hypothetical protein